MIEVQYNRETETYEPMTEKPGAFETKPSLVACLVGLVGCLLAVGLALWLGVQVWDAISGMLYSDRGAFVAIALLVFGASFLTALTIKLYLQYKDHGAPMFWAIVLWLLVVWQLAIAGGGA